MQLHSVTLGILALATLGACVHSTPATVIENVLKKLEDFATGVRVMSGLSREDLFAAADAWKAIPEDMRAYALERPQYKLLYHFCIAPTERIRGQLDSRVASIAHIYRLEEAYKRFRPAYLGQIIDEFETGNLEMDKLEGLFFKLAHRQACTLGEFESLNKEHLALLARFDSIVVHNDVYANQDEMRNILNYHNNELVKPLFDHVLPLLGKVSDPAILQQLYYDKLFATMKISFDRNGEPVRHA